MTNFAFPLRKKKSAVVNEGPEGMPEPEGAAVSPPPRFNPGLPPGTGAKAREPRPRPTPPAPPRKGGTTFF